MARSGYLLDDLLVGRGLELVGGHVAKGAVQAGAVEPGDVFHGRVACGGAGGPGLVVEALAFQGGEERLGERVVPALAGAARRQADREIVGEGGVVAAAVLATLVRVEHHPGAGSRAATALVSASQASSVRSCSVRRSRPPGGRRCRSRWPGTASLPRSGRSDVATPAGVDRGGVDGEVPADQVGSGGRRRVS